MCDKYCINNDDWMCSLFFFFKQKTAYEMRISDWSSDVCSSDLTSRCDTDRRGCRAARQAIRSQDGGPCVDGTLQWQSCLSREGRTQREPPSWSYAVSQIGRASCRERVCQSV